MRNRTDVDVKDTWDLTLIYKDDDAWYEEYESLKKEIDTYDQFQSTMMNSAQDLLELLVFDQKISRTLDKLYVYANMKSDEDKRNQTYLKMLGEITSLFTMISKKTAYIVPTLMKYQYAKIEEWMKEEPKLLEFEHSLKDIYRYQPYTLSETEEKLIATYSSALSKIGDTYDLLTTSDMNLGTIQDEDGNNVELREGNYTLYIRSKDRRVRKQAFETLLGGYAKFQNTIASTFTGMLELAKANAEAHHYESTIGSYLFADDLDETVYTNLINVVNNHMDTLMRYYHLKKKVLGLDEMHIYDIYVDLTEKASKTYSFEEGKNIVIDALNVLGDDYITNLKRAFMERWIDIYPTAGKTSGAYSGGSYDTLPYVLLNYNGTLNDVSTIAHELGHSMHSYYTRSNNGYETGDYSIFVAEIASTVNELLLSHYLLEHSKEKDEKRQILSEMMDLFKSTIYRQTMFAEFERKMHGDTEEGKTLTSEQINKAYYDLNLRYFEPEIIVDEKIQYEWERIPHFYTPFYVYKYATGLSCACKIVTDILSGKEHAVENYIAFLKNGSKDYPKEHLKMVGIDITKTDYIESAIAMFDDTITKMEKLLES